MNVAIPLTRVRARDRVGHHLIRAFMLVTLAAAAAPAQSTEPRGALPYDLAFDRRAFLSSTALAVTADGQRVAYDVRRPPADSTLSVRYLPSGTPASSVGARVYFTDRSSGRTTEVCPGGNCWRPSWSPDGRSLAFYSDSGGPPQLWIYELATGRARRVTASPIKAKLWTGDEARWSPDGGTLYVPLAPEGEYRSPARPAVAMAANAAGVSVLRSGTEAASAPGEKQPLEPMIAHFLRENLAAIGAVDVRTGSVRIIAPATAAPLPSVVRLSASGRWASFLSVFKFHGATNQTSTIDLAVVPASGGAPRMIAEDLPLLSDYHGLNYSWHPRDDRLVYIKDDKLWLVDVGSDGVTAPRQLGASLGPLAPTINWFTRDGRSVVVGTDPKDDRGYGDVRPRGIAVVPLDGGAPTHIAVDDVRWEFQRILKSDERTVWQPDGSSVTLVLQERATGERGVVRLDPATGRSTVLWKGLARLDNATAGGGQSSIVATYEDLRTPADVFVFPADFATRQRVSHIEPRFDSVAVGTAEIITTTVPMFDGSLATVRTAVLLPPGAKRGDQLPAIVMMYPGGDVSREAERIGGGSTTTVPTLVFTSRGYAVVLANLSLGPNGEAGNPMQEMVDVLLPQIYHAAELGYIDVKRLALSGQSFGGYGTAAVISRTNLFRAAAAVSGIYDLAGTYGHLQRDGSAFWIGWSEGGQARMGTHPWANVRRYLDNSPYYQADKIFTPLLLIHGTDDEAYDDAQKLFSALRRLNRPAQLASYAGQGHVIYEWRRASAIDAAQRMVGFFRAHLGNPPTRRGSP